MKPGFCFGNRVSPNHKNPVSKAETGFYSSAFRIPKSGLRRPDHNLKPMILAAVPPKIFARSASER